jgi:hypothetical protein
MGVKGEALPSQLKDVDVIMTAGNREVIPGHLLGVWRYMCRKTY